MRLVKVAATQMECSSRRERNVREAEGLVRQAASEGARIVVLQELFETPYFCQVEDPAHFALATELGENEAVKRFCRLAAELEVVLPVSFFERCGPAHFNSVAVVDADGRILGTYRKTHIPGGPGYEEKFYFNPGDTGFRVWSTRYGRLGVGICWDQWFPEAARCMALMGAEMLLYPTAIGSEPADPLYDSKDHWQICMRGHAHRLPLPVVCYNQSMDLNEVRKLGLPRVGGCICSDGAFEAHTAALFEPYADEPDNCGTLTYSTDHRHRIEHLELPTWSQIERMARAGIMASMQPAFVPAFIGSERMEIYEQLLGKARLRRVHPYRTILDAGIPVSGGSDSPVTPYAPLTGVQAAVIHPNEDQRVNVLEALRMFTSTGAWSAFEEKEKGTLEPGKRADLVVLDADPLTVAPGKIGDGPEIDAVAGFLSGFNASGRGARSLAVRGRIRFPRALAFGLLRLRGVRHFLSRRWSFHPLLPLSPSLDVREGGCPVLGPQPGFGGPHRMRLPPAARSGPRLSRRLSPSPGARFLGETGRVAGNRSRCCDAALWGELFAGSHLA